MSIYTTLECGHHVKVGDECTRCAVCRECGGSGATLELVEKDGTNWLKPPQLCPCVTDRLEKLTKVAEAARRVLEVDTAPDYGLSLEAWNGMRDAVNALEESK